MKSKYLNLLEDTLTRFQRGGYLVGDYIKLADGYKKTDGYKNMPANMQAALDEVGELSKNMHLRVVAIKNQYPSTQPGNANNTNGVVAVDIGLDYGGGRYYSVLTAPSDVLERVDYGINQAPLPDALKRDNIITLKPEPVETDKDSEAYRQTRKTSQGGKKDEDSESVLNNTNVKIPAQSAKSTADYMKGVK